ncbi:class I adenylate-forming enzyme family protein [Peristeroidobacter soli]|uniref:class I adenylate-forming enzyme family protein n=1 Tax=Peristeroidobacter soli TaxID=2497877 RepID=UPI00101B8DB6|nr:class I adenylate-forming enzyme family protein [Peristeroidobacter soli]
MIEPPFLRRISDYVAWYAAATPDAPAMVIDEHCTSYRELARQVDELSRALLAAGVQRGDRVATLTTPHPEYLVVFLATASLGAIWVGLNPRYQRQELLYVLSDSEPKIVLTRTRIAGRDYLPELHALRRSLPQIEHWIALDEMPAGGELTTLPVFLNRGNEIAPAHVEQARTQVAPEDPALIVYTSGSTGQPKGALLPHRGLVRCSLVQYSQWHPAPLRTLNFFPINHIGCVGDVSCYTLVAGGCIVFLEKFDPAAVLERIESQRVTFWGGVPTTFLLSMADPAFASTDLSSLQFIFWSGAAASVELVDRLAAMGVRLATSYGLTETVGSVTFTSADASREELAETIGSAPAAYEVRLADANGEVTARDTPGEIQVRGDFIMCGYWRRPDATADAIDREGWLHTGDLAVRRADGRLRLVGRLKEIFKSGGYNIYPREIEQALELHASVALAAVVAVPDPIYGEVGHAFVVATGSEPSSEELQAHCRRLLANYKVPKRFTVLRDPPMLPIGKIDKRRLRELALAEQSM